MYPVDAVTAKLHTLSEVQVGAIRGRDVLRSASDRVDAGVLEDGVHKLSMELNSKRDIGNLAHGTCCESTISTTGIY
jgi:hypothetical protein